MITGRPIFRRLGWRQWTLDIHRPSAECASAVAAYEMIMRPLRRRRTPISEPCPAKAVGWASPDSDWLNLVHQGNPVFHMSWRGSIQAERMPDSNPMPRWCAFMYYAPVDPFPQSERPTTAPGWSWTRDWSPQSVYVRERHSGCSQGCRASLFSCPFGDVVSKQTPRTGHSSVRCGQPPCYTWHVCVNMCWCHMCSVACQGSCYSLSIPGL